MRFLGQKVSYVARHTQTDTQTHIQSDTQTHRTDTHSEMEWEGTKGFWRISLNIKVLLLGVNFNVITAENGHVSIAG